MNYKIPYSWYYHPNFVDPLYSQYLTTRNLTINPFLLNHDEFRDGSKGIYHRKKNTENNCPPGYSCSNLDYCYPQLKETVGLYSSKNYPFVKEYINNSIVSIDNYGRSLQT